MGTGLAYNVFGSPCPNEYCTEDHQEAPLITDRFNALEQVQQLSQVTWAQTLKDVAVRDAHAQHKLAAGVLRGDLREHQQQLAGAACARTPRCVSALCAKGKLAGTGSFCFRQCLS